MKRKLKWKNIILILIALILIIIFLIILTSNKKEEVKEKYVHLYISSKENMASLYDLNNEKIDEVNRGYKIIVNEKNYNDENDYIEITYNNKKVFVLKEDLVKDRIEIVKEKEIYVRTHTTLYENINNSKINGVSNKGEKLEVIGYDQLLDTGEVNAYKILKDGIESYVYAKYIVLDEEEALLHYEPDKYYNIHENRRDFYSNVGGTGARLDYYPFTKPIFEDNIMPEKVYAFYLNGGRNIIGNIDAYIEYAKKTKINAFVVDIKDYKAPAYKSKVYEKMSPTNYKYAINSFDNYKNAIKKLKDNGFYVIGRITAFKDDYLVKDNPEVGIYDKRYNKSFDDGTWPSAFSRFVWEFNIELAKEAVKEMGFNEIQFDYVRFPDRIVGLEKNNSLDFRNEYEEEKIQAIQRFLMYACDEIHKLNAYVSADVFGESVNKYITAYGQYWPAISNVVDVISGMPYPDHFALNSYGIPIPWENPYDLIYNWSKEAYNRQQEIPTPAIVRTWILAQNPMQGYKYNSNEIEQQIKALFDAKLDGGYMTWSSSSSLLGYKNRNSAYIKEY